jgi:hypothetical protein
VPSDFDEQLSAFKVLRCRVTPTFAELRQMLLFAVNLVPGLADTYSGGPRNVPHIPETARSLAVVCRTAGDLPPYTKWPAMLQIRRQAKPGPVLDIDGLGTAPLRQLDLRCGLRDLCSRRRRENLA